MRVMPRPVRNSCWLDGKEVALGLARAGHQVVLVGRDADKGARVEREMRETTSNAHVQFLQADLSLVREANRLADEIAFYPL